MRLMIIMSTSSYKEYVSLMVDYKKKCGPNIIILYQQGIFYEIYSKVGDCVNFDDAIKILGLNHYVKNDIRIAGIPINSLDDYLSLVFQKNYTAIIVEQIGTKKHKT